MRSTFHCFLLSERKTEGEQNIYIINCISTLNVWNVILTFKIEIHTAMIANNFRCDIFALMKIFPNWHLCSNVNWKMPKVKCDETIEKKKKDWTSYFLERTDNQTTGSEHSDLWWYSKLCIPIMTIGRMKNRLEGKTNK